MMILFLKERILLFYIIYMKYQGAKTWFFSQIFIRLGLNLPLI